MNDQTQDFAEQGTAFQRIWMESMSKVMQAAGTFAPNSASPEMVREARNGLLRALGESWDEFLRSPEFQKEMKQAMDNATSIRLMSNDFMAKMRNEMQAPSRDDTDAIQLNVRHMEKRILVRLFGDYQSPIDIFKQYYQPDLADAFAHSNPSPLPFGIGYRGWDPKKSALIVATRR